jgi:hypothetical protein
LHLVVSMKSILALLCIVAVANAGIIKSGSLKGAWDDTVDVESADEDMTAPGIDYDADEAVALYSNCYDFDTTGACNTTDYGYAYFYLYFQITGEAGETGSYDDFDFDNVGTVMVTYWTGTDAEDPVAWFMPSCDNDGDNAFTCTFMLREHMTPGTYMPMITAMDNLGNWMVFDETDFTDTDNSVVFELVEEHPDVAAPLLTAAAVSDLTIELGAVNDVDSVLAFTEVSVVVNDGNYYYDSTDTTDPAFDWRSSGIMSVWTTVSWEDEDGETVMEDFALYYEETVDDDAGTRRYGTRFTFTPVSEPQTYTVVSVSAADYAGNVATTALTAQDVVVSFDDTMLEDDGGVFACQTFTITPPVGSLDNTDPFVVTATEGVYIYATHECTTKSTTGTNYVAFAFRTEEYTPGQPDPATGEDEVEIRQKYWDWYAGDNGVGYVTQTAVVESGMYISGLDDTPYTETVGYSTTGISGSYVYLPARAIDGEYELSDLVTITSYGGLQWYSIEFGAASSVAPSVFAVAIAAVVALLRL